MDEALLGSHLERLATDGYTIVTDAFPTDMADELRERLDRITSDEARGPGDNSFEGHATWRVYNLLTRGPAFEVIPTWPTVLPIVEGVLDRGCLISSLSSIAIGPGEVAQPIHADDQVMPLPRPHPATVCNTMWALTDFTEANGATRICPGTHLSDHAPTYGTHPRSIAAEMPKGSVLVWHGSLWHGGGANTTDASRMGIAMNYCAGWIRQQENQQLGIPLTTVAGFTTRLRELCGFGIYRGLIGHIEKRSPAQHLFDDPGDPMLWERV